MNKLSVRNSFRMRLFASILLGALLPLILCMTFFVTAFEMSERQRGRDETKEVLAVITKELDSIGLEHERAAEEITGDATLKLALGNNGFVGQVRQVLVNNVLFSASEGQRAYARFDIYDAYGYWKYSTESVASIASLPVDLGILYQAADAPDMLVSLATEDVTDTTRPLFMQARAIVGSDGTILGFLTISMYQEHFRSLLEGKYGTQNDLILIDSRLRPVYCIQPALALSLTEAVRENILSGAQNIRSQSDYIITLSGQTMGGMTVLLRRPRMLTGQGMILFQLVGVACLVIGLVIALIFGVLLSRELFAPIHNLSGAMQQVTNGDLTVRLPVQESAGDELDSMADDFNRMTGALAESQEMIRLEERRMNEAQIRMLQAQLNPHFLGNTLDTIKWMGKINGSPEIAEMAEDLADILRYAISPDEFTTLLKEIEILEPYIEIQRIRKSGGLRFLVEIPSALDDCPVPRMILQPMVENAVLHGLNTVQEGTILVSAKREEEMLIIRVIDDGIGIPDSMIGPYKRPEPEDGRHHMGLYNVDMIIKKHYGEQYGLSLRQADKETLDRMHENGKESGTGRGAEVTARLPMTIERGDGG